jgi:hypothetical protein
VCGFWVLCSLLFVVLFSLGVFGFLVFEDLKKKKQKGEKEKGKRM